MGRQIAMVMELNKCIGCQSCTSACKSLWTGGESQELILYNNVETKPGPGYPRNWEEKAKQSGWKDGKLRKGPLHANEDFGGEKPLNHEEVYFLGTETRLQQKEPMGYGAN